MIWFKFIITLVLSWFPFMCVHELGHILSTQFTNGKIKEIILVPWRFSQTIIVNSNHPLVDAWAGSIVGTLIPVILYLILKQIKKDNFYISTFSGFCLLANGFYMGLGWVDKIGDAGDILNHNGNIGSMIIFGLICSIAGLVVWHQAIECEKNKNTELSFTC